MPYLEPGYSLMHPSTTFVFLPVVCLRWVLVVGSYELSSATQINHYRLLHVVAMSQIYFGFLVPVETSLLLTHILLLSHYAYMALYVHQIACCRERCYRK